MILSGESRKIIDELMVILDFTRPQTVKLALAKGIAISTDAQELKNFDLSEKWEFGESIIDGNDYLMFKHLIINEQKRPLTEEEISKYMGMFIEIGSRHLKSLLEKKNSIEDLRLVLLK